MKPRFQFTIRDMLWATFWLSLSMGAFGYFAAHLRDWEYSNSYARVLASLLIGVASPVLAIIAIFGRGRRAYWVIVVAGVVAIVLLSFVLPRL